MRESSGSEEEEATETEDSRWGNTTWCSCDFCLNWEAGTARKGMHLLPRDRGAMNKSQVNGLYSKGNKNNLITKRFCWLLLFCVISIQFEKLFVV